MTKRSRAIPPVVFEDFDEEVHLIASSAMAMLNDRSVRPDFAFGDDMAISNTSYSGRHGEWSVGVASGRNGSLDIWMNGLEPGGSTRSIEFSVDPDERWPGDRSGDPSTICSRLRHINEVLARHSRQRPGRLSAALAAWRRSEEIMSAWAHAGDSRRIDFHPTGPWGPGVFTVGGSAVDDTTPRWLIANTPSVLILKRSGVRGWRLGRMRIRRRSSEMATSVAEAMRIMTKYPEAFR